MARETISSDLGRDDSRFAITRSAGQLIAGGSGVSATFGRAGVVARNSSGAAVRLGLEAVGRGSSLERIGLVSPLGRSNRVSYDRSGIDEWYANGPLGLEQGFTINHRVSGTGDLTLVVGRVPAGATATLKAGGKSLAIGGSRGTGGSLRYSNLSVSDARGRRLPATITLAGGRILVLVDDAYARYPLRIDPTVETSGVTLLATGREPSDLFGYAVAMSQDGSTIAVGAPSTWLGNVGDVYVFTRPASGGWQNATTQTATLDTGSADGFGLSVGVSGTGGTIVVGAPVYGSTDGTVYLFSRPSGGWQNSSTPTTVLTASDGSPSDEFGDSVAISGDGSTVVAGAPAHASSAGAAYVFTEPVNGWQSTTTQTAELTASDSAPNDEFGDSVAISADGGAVVAGAPGHMSSAGAAYVFTEPTGGWQSTSTQTAELRASSGQTGLGGSVALSADGRTIVADGTGSAEVFSKPASGTWQDATQTAKLPQDNGGSTVGVAVSEDGVTIMIGSLSTTASGAGRADVFYEPGSTWPSETPTLELGGADIPSSAPLTHSVAISDDGSTAVIGSSGNPEGGAVTVFSGLSSTLAEPGISTAPPTITGTAVEGDVLAASTGTWNNLPTSYAYVWEHCSATGQQCSPIPGATGQTYTLTASDVGQRIAVEVTAANQWGTGMPAVSAATGAVPESGPVGLEIDNGNYATDDPNVTIEATWPVGTQSILISNNGGFRTDTETVPPAATIPWKLEQTGTDRLPKTVYVRFLGVGQDDINFTDDIILDETAPTIESATLNGAGSAQASAARASKLRTYRLRLKAKDELVGVCEGATNQRRSSKGQTLAPLTSCQARGVLKLSRTLELKLRSRPRYARIRNSAGDWSRWIPVTS